MRCVILAVLCLAGCGLPKISITPTPDQPSPTPPIAVTPQEIHLKLEVSHDGTVKHVGPVQHAGKVTVRTEQSDTQPTTACPCCGNTRRCLGRCGKPDCTCRDNRASAEQPIDERPLVWVYVLPPDSYCEPCNQAKLAFSSTNDLPFRVRFTDQEPPPELSRWRGRPLFHWARGDGSGGVYEGWLGRQQFVEMWRRSRG